MLRLIKLLLEPIKHALLDKNYSDKNTKLKGI
jgi:hypothetical protein